MSEEEDMQSDSPESSLRNRKKERGEEEVAPVSQPPPAANKWRNAWIRSLYSLPMIGGFLMILWLGPLYVALLVIVLQVKSFHELMIIGHSKYSSLELPWYRVLNWYFLGVANYFFFGESLTSYFRSLFIGDDYLNKLASYHRFISYWFYLVGFIAFVLSLKKKKYMVQFQLFGWTHIVLLCCVVQSHLIIQNCFEGLYWLLYPASMVICNDIMAYFFGFFFGKTPLIKLSPKKTWEGFIGGFVSTMVFGVFVSKIMYQFKHLICPVEYDGNALVISNCDPGYVFNQQTFNLPLVVQGFLSVFGVSWEQVSFRPIHFHGQIMAMFASLIAPFGGFFASGFKRAFKLKDFGDLIPGHGGVVDRMDCQFLMGTFVYVYYFSFIKNVSVNSVLQIIYGMTSLQQHDLYISLGESLASRGLI